MKRLFWAAPFALLALLALHPLPANAALQICNKTDHSLTFAIATLIGDCEPDCLAHSTGWWNVEPGSCKTPLGGELDTSGDTIYYYYAEDSNGSTWTGTFSLCVNPKKAFDFDDNQNASCAGAHRKFRRINTGNSSDFTVNLTR